MSIFIKYGVMAQYIEGFDVRFLDYDYELLKLDVVKSGGTATPPSNPTRTDWFFNYWGQTYEESFESTDTTHSLPITTVIERRNIDLYVDDVLVIDKGTVLDSDYVLQINTAGQSIFMFSIFYTDGVNPENVIIFNNDGTISLTNVTIDYKIVIYNDTAVLSDIEADKNVYAQYKRELEWTLTTENDYDLAINKGTYSLATNPDVCRTQEQVKALVDGLREPNTYNGGYEWLFVLRVQHKRLIDNPPFDPYEEDCTTYYYKATWVGA